MRKKEKNPNKVLGLEDSHSHLQFLPVTVFSIHYQNLMHHTCYTVLNIRLSISHSSVSA